MPVCQEVRRQLDTDSAECMAWHRRRGIPLSRGNAMPPHIRRIWEAVEEKEALQTGGGTLSVGRASKRCRRRGVSATLKEMQPG